VKTWIAAHTIASHRMVARFRTVRNWRAVSASGEARRGLEGRFDITTS
jgi:hypothetical protein